ncbi:MAG: CCA tRNA nucleotidyltransferase, partial [Flavobacteriaceae bacterium]
MRKDTKEAISNPVFTKIVDSSRDLDLETYVIGGFVRDFLLGNKAPKDIDIVTVGSGIALARKVAEKLSGKPRVQVFKNFGTAMVHYQDFELEFVGARKESYRKESRKPTVENGSLEDDQKRRDFTINTLAISLNKSTYGQLLDPFQGLQDLQKGIIRTPLDPEITYSDDPLRMLRAIRFAAQLDFEIELSSLQAITTHKERIRIVSRERIVDELHKIMLCKKPSTGLRLLHKTELMPLILPELSALEGIEEVEGQRHKDNFWHTLEV